MMTCRSSIKIYISILDYDHNEIEINIFDSLITVESGKITSTAIIIMSMVVRSYNFNYY